MIYNRSEALRYLGTTENNVGAANLVDLVYLKMRNEIHPRSVSRAYACEADEAAGTVLVGGSVVFHSRALAAHLSGCSRLIVFAATLGVGVDIAMHRLTLGSTAEAAAAQAVAAAVIEGYCDEVDEELVAAEQGLYGRPRFSPGYGDWALEEQRLLMALIDCKKIGLTLTEGCMLVPVKSVTAVIGLTTDASAANCREKKCELCPNKGCVFRSREMDSGEDDEDDEV